MPGEVVHLKCAFCDEAHLYEFSNERVFALDGLWASGPADEQLLHQTPEVGNEYHVSISGPLKIDLSGRFWIVYLPVTAAVNGIETEKDLDEMRFCLCESNSIMAQSDCALTMRVKILDLKKPGDTMAAGRPDIAWLILLNDQNKKYTSVLEFETHIVVIVNIQSDLGLTAVFKKEENTRILIAVNEWDFHKNLWYLVNEAVSKEMQRRWGVDLFNGQST